MGIFLEIPHLISLSSSPARKPLRVIGALLMFVLATVAVVQFTHTSDAMPTAPTAPPKQVENGRAALEASAAADAFGRSGGVTMRFVLPGHVVVFPVDVAAGADSVKYCWVKIGDSTSAEPSRALTDAPLYAPMKPGFYQLALTHGIVTTVLPQPTLAVMVPFEQKVAGRLNGYQIGSYLAERFNSAQHERPDGFIEVSPDMLELQVSKHMKVGDFVTHDQQGDVWPKYIALNPRILDKMELIFAELPQTSRPGAVDVHSGFRTPSWNARVPRSAEDSRHQYGDAADVAIDVDGDGKVTMTDGLLVMLAIEKVEERNPDLVGGTGFYYSKRFPVPYLHIDARGKRTRWSG